MKHSIFAFLLLFCSAASFAQPNVFKVNTKNVIGKNTQFWKASGDDLLYYLA